MRARQYPDPALEFFFLEALTTLFTPFLRRSAVPTKGVVELRELVLEGGSVHPLHPEQMRFRTKSRLYSRMM
jgi:hypothetical protein